MNKNPENTENSEDKIESDKTKLNNEDKIESDETKLNNEVNIDEISLEEKLKETEDKLLRSLAEIENQRRRFEKEIKDAFEYGGFNFAKETLSILDNLQRAKGSIKSDESLINSPDLKSFLKNIDIIEKDLINIFEKNKINKIKSVDQKFDPNLHQAMLEIEDDKADPGTIIQEIQAGYMYGERLLRPSFVGVAKKKGSKNEKKEEKKND